MLRLFHTQNDFMKAVFLLVLVSAGSALIHGAEVADSSIKSAPTTVLATAKLSDKQPAAAASPIKTNAPPPASAAGSYTEHDTMLEFQKASAKKGFAQSQYIMALRYLSGNCVPKDTAQAQQLLEAAAKQGHGKAREKLQELKHADRGT